MSHLLILAGPSAVGKTTVMEHMLRMRSDLIPIRSMTTRPRRSEGEDEYLHVDDAAFARAVTQGELLEHTTYGAYRYGTPKSEIARAEAMGKAPLLILELSGVRSIKEGTYAKTAVAVYLYDELSVMEHRLYERELAQRPSEAARTVFERRREANRRDYASMPSHAALFDLFIKNREPQDTARSILAAFDRIVCGDTVMPEDEKAAITEALAAGAPEKENYRA